MISGADINTVGYSTLKAIHPHWRGFLTLYHIDKSIVHQGVGNKGTFDFLNGVLTVYWDHYEPDIFIQISDLFVHNDIIENMPNIDKLFAVSIHNTPFVMKKISVGIPKSKYEIILRLHTTDIPTFDQIFVRYEYENENLPGAANAVVDLGANIGLASVFFGLKYPNAKILSVEPEEGNYKAMVNNTAALGERVQTENAAVWVRDGLIYLHTESEDGAPLGEWGVQVSERLSENQSPTKCFKLSTLLDKAGFDSVDILKVDIEGAELEVFSNGAEEWLSRINLIVIETHDRFRPGSEVAVRRALYPMFDELPLSRESLFFRRKTP
jgi:FkbM family methyltransferase